MSEPHRTAKAQPSSGRAEEQSPPPDLLSELLSTTPGASPPAAPQITVNGQPFFGRVEEQNQFRVTLDTLLNTPPGETLPFVLLLYGDGGIGKTTLARRFRDIIGSEYRDQFQMLWVDWEDERRRAPRLQVGREHIGASELFDSLYAIAMRVGWKEQFAQYQSALKERAEAEQKAAEVLSSAGEKDEFTELRGASSGVIAKLVRFAAPVVGDVGESLVRSFADAGIKGGAEGLKRLRDAATTQLKARLDPDKLDIYLYPDERLAAALAEGFRKIAEKKPLVVFLDTYEQVDRADHLLRMVMQGAGPQLLWVIAGRDNLLRSRQFGDDYYKGYAEEWPRRLLAYDMRQLARDDVRDYFATCVPERPLDEPTLAAISRATRGIPLAVREAADIWKGGHPLADLVGDITDGTPTGAIVRHMTERYQLHCIHNEADRQLLYVLALAQGDIEILRVMVQLTEGNGGSLESTLRRLERDYASVHREHTRLHDDPAAFFLEHLKDPLRRTEPWLRQCIELACTTLRARLEQKQQSLPLLEERCDDEDWVKAALDLSGYLFWLDEEQAWRWLIPRFVESLVYSDELRRGLVRQAESWRRWLSKGGGKRLRLLRSSIPFMTDAEGDLLDELARLDRVRWLDGEGEAERKAIICLRHGQLAQHRKDYAQAMQWYKQAEQGLTEGETRLKQKLGKALYELAGKLLWPNDAKYAVSSVEAEQLLRKVVMWLPQDQYAHARMGSALGVAAKYDEAIAAYQQAIALDPKAAYPHSGLGNVYRHLGRFEEAIAAYQQAITLAPKAAYLHSGLGNVYRHLGRFDKAIAACQQASNLDPKDAEPHIGLGNLYALLGRSDKAIIAYQQASTLAPNDADPYTRLGRFYLVFGRFDKAIVTFQQASILDPKDAEPHIGLGLVYAWLGRFEDAVIVFHQAIALNPEYTTPHIALGLVYALLGRLDAALDTCTQALELDPEKDWAFYHRGLTHRLMGAEQAAASDLASAITSAEQTYQQRPHDWFNRFNLAIYTLAAGNDSAAQQHYEAALRDDAPPWFIREAINDLTQFLQLFPGHTQAEAWRQRLQAHLDGANQG